MVVASTDHYDLDHPHVLNSTFAREGEMKLKWHGLLVAAAGPELQWEDRPGPDPQPIDDSTLAGLSDGRYVTFSGADLVQVRYDTACTQQATGTQMTGTLTSWDAPAFGILQCSTQAPAGSSAALVQKYCAL